MRQIPDYLPALTIRQPWADLILSGVKDVENRHWSTRFRGPLLIHSSKAVAWEEVAELQRDRLLPRDYRPVIGAILGLVEVVGCVTDHPSQFFHGPYGFTMRNPCPFSRPIPFSGQPGIFNVPVLVLSAVASEIESFSQLPAASLYQAGT